jgi:capsular polysaccharide biosynthesis protein
MLKEVKGSLLLSILVGVFVASLSFLFLINTTYQQRATAEVLVVQDQLGTQDYYSLTKSAEYLGNILVEAVYSTTFIDLVKNSGEIDKNFFPKEQRNRLEKWQKMVKIDRSVGLGILKIVVLSDNKDEAYKLATTVTNVLKDKNYLFRGKANVDVRLLSDVMVEKNPNLKTMLMTIVGGFSMGFFLSIVLFYYRKTYKHARLISGSSLFL